MNENLLISDKESPTQEKSIQTQGNLYCIWSDPCVTEADVRQALASNLPMRVAYMSYILNDARFEDIWQTLTLAEVQKHFWQIRWRTDGLRDNWRQILTLLGHPPEACVDPCASAG